MNKLEKIKTQHESTGFVLGQDIIWMINRIEHLNGIIEDIQELVPDLIIHELFNSDFLEVKPV